MHDAAATSLTACEQHSAAGLFRGVVKVHNSATLQVASTVADGEQIRLPGFKRYPSEIADGHVCGPRMPSLPLRHYDPIADIDLFAIEYDEMLGQGLLPCVHVFAFETTLKHMYRISAVDELMRDIVFAPNNLDFYRYHVRGALCNVWKLSVLVRCQGFDDGSTTDPLSDKVPMVPETSGSTQWNWFGRQGCDLPIKVGEADNERDSTSFEIVNASKLEPDADNILATCFSKRDVGDVNCVIGLRKTTLLFLDNKGWTCSVLKRLHDTATCTRHFFIPLAWMTGKETGTRIISRNSIALANRH
ncbi:hypothetical protein MKZ38_009682 [Zalerion maritima]|uniref:Uncharacterized protein n=1 Tax=Zalerion maritima TaxID=339359 RepID=A0AAD5RUT9_9PEZI|nr:hypothetical protein MKZ38_009682 [Zalerion maritima]